MIHLVNLNTGPDKITLKYFTVGHTFMSADTFHKMVEGEMKKMGKVLDWKDFIDCVNPCGISLEMNFSDFKEYEKALSHGIVSEKTRPLLENVSVAEFRKGSTSMFYKCSHDTDEEFSETEYLIKRVHDGIREGDYFVPSRSHPRHVGLTVLSCRT